MATRGGGLFGAISSSVSGMTAESSKISAASNHIANVNTEAFKRDSVHFLTLVNESSGGVQTTTRHVIDEQGTLKNTGKPTDLAISGNGMFVVNETADGLGRFLFTRSGSFRQDALGNFVNPAGYSLFAWPLDSEGRLPGQTGNLDTTSSALLESLEAVNLRAVSGAVAATTKIEFGLNLDATEKILEGAGQTSQIVNSSNENRGIGLNDIIVPNANMRAGNNIVIGTGVTSYTFEYGGYSNSVDISSGVLGTSTTQGVFINANNGDKFTIGNAFIGNLTFTYTPSSPDTSKGQFNNLVSLAEAINVAAGTAARVSGNRLYISPEDASQALNFNDVTGTFVASLGLYDVTAAGAPLSNNGVSQSNNIAGGILGATTTASTFTAVNGDAFTITLPSPATTITLTYNNPPGPGQFSTMQQLANLINTTYNTDLMAGIDNGILYISPIATSRTMTFANTGGTDFVGALGFQDTTVYPGLIKRFNTLKGLANLARQTSDLGVVATGELGDATLKIYNKDPLGTIYYTYTRPTPLALSNMLLELGLTKNNAPAVPTGPAYDPTGATAFNMASRKVVPQFSRNVEIFDPLGTRHDFQVSFVKTNINTWAAELYALNPTELVSSRTDGLVAYGTIRFNGDGSLRSVSPSLTNPIGLSWANGASQSSVSVNWGTAGEPAGTAGASIIGLKDGLQQISSDYNVSFVEKNGVSAALLSSIEVTEDGFVVANYANGLSQKLYKIPLADFPNFNGLNPLNGNVYETSQKAGDFNLKEANKGGVGIIKSGAIEQSNVELADELTNLVISQRSYEANAKSLTTSNGLLETLIQMFR